MKCCLGLLLLGALLGTGCRRTEPDSTSPTAGSAKTWNRTAAQSDYALLRAELALADSGKPYLVLHLPKKELQLRLKGVVVWQCPLTPSDDWEEVETFVHRFLGDDQSLVRAVTERYLFGAQEKNSDSVLAIVGGALGIDHNLMQREIPSRFQIHWTNKLILDVHTDVTAKPISKFKNTMMQVTQLLSRPFVEAHLHIKMNPDKAITFWRAVSPGVFTLVIP